MAGSLAASHDPRTGSPLGRPRVRRSQTGKTASNCLGTGLPVYITQFDIGLADDEKQRAQDADYLTMFWDAPHVKGVTIWGYITGATWRANTGIMNSTGSMRPAMTWLMDFLKR